MSKILTAVLELAGSYQNGRVSGDLTPVSFTEGWLPGGASEIVPEVLQSARGYQTGRGKSNVPNGTTHRCGFTSPWFQILPVGLTIPRVFQRGRGNSDLPAGNSQHGFRTSDVSEIVTGVLDLAKSHQTPHVTDDVTSVTIDAAAMSRPEVNTRLYTICPELQFFNTASGHINLNRGVFWSE